MLFGLDQIEGFVNCFARFCPRNEKDLGRKALLNKANRFSCEGECYFVHSKSFIFVYLVADVDM